MNLQEIQIEILDEKKPLNQEDKIDDIKKKLFLKR